MSPPAVSVVISAHNGQNYVGAAIESVLAQTMPDFELIVVDDGSTDSTPKIVAEYAVRDQRVWYHGLPHGGVSVARNCGLMLAHTPWVACLDQDDLMLPQRLERQLAFISAHPGVRVVGSLCEYINDAAMPLGGLTIGAPIRCRSDMEDMLKRGQLIALTHSSCTVHRDTILCLGGYDPDSEPAEDVDLWTRVAECGHLILQQDEVLTQYRIRLGSQVGAGTERISVAGRHAKARAEARRAGVPMPSRQEFAETWNALPVWRRWERKRVGWVMYRAAGTLLLNGHWLTGAAYLAAATALRPIHTPRRLCEQLLKTRTEMRRA